MAKNDSLTKLLIPLDLNKETYRVIHQLLRSNSVTILSIEKLSLVNLNQAEGVDFIIYLAESTNDVIHLRMTSTLGTEEVAFKAVTSYYVKNQIISSPLSLDVLYAKVKVLPGINDFRIKISKKIWSQSSVRSSIFP